MMRLSAALMALNEVLGGLPLEILKTIRDHYLRENRLGRALQAGKQTDAAAKVRAAIAADVKMRGTDAHVDGAIRLYVPVLFDLPEVPAPGKQSTTSEADTPPPVRTMGTDQLRDLLDAPARTPAPASSPAAAAAPPPPDKGGDPG